MDNYFFDRRTTIHNVCIMWKQNISGMNKESKLLHVKRKKLKTLKQYVLTIIRYVFKKLDV